MVGIGEFPNTQVGSTGSINRPPVNGLHSNYKDRFFYYILNVFAKLEWRRAVVLVTNHLSKERVSRIFQKATSLNNTSLVERMPGVDQPLLKPGGPQVAAIDSSNDEESKDPIEVTARYNQTNTPNENRGQVQPCGSNALAFLNKIFQKKGMLTPDELDKIIEEGREADIAYRTKDPGNPIEANIGIEFTELQGYHDEKVIKTFRSIGFNKTAELAKVGFPDHYIAAKKESSQVDFSELKDKIKDDSGALIYKGGKTYAIYKKDGFFYFFDSHGRNDVSGAYLIKGTDVNKILRSVEYLSLIPDDADENSPHRQIQFFVINQS